MIDESELMINDIVEYANEGIACFCRVVGIVNDQVLLHTLKDKGEYVAKIGDIRTVELSEKFLLTNEFSFNTMDNEEHYNKLLSGGHHVHVVFKNHHLEYVEIIGVSPRYNATNLKHIHLFQNALRSCDLNAFANKLTL